jgi:hypothetical protein
MDRLGDVMTGGLALDALPNASTTSVIGSAFKRCSKVARFSWSGPTPLIGESVHAAHDTFHDKPRNAR